MGVMFTAFRLDRLTECGLLWLWYSCGDLLGDTYSLRVLLYFCRMSTSSMRRHAEMLHARLLCSESFVAVCYSVWKQWCVVGS